MVPWKVYWRCSIPMSDGGCEMHDAEMAKDLPWESTERKAAGGAIANPAPQGVANEPTPLDLSKKRKHQLSQEEDGMSRGDVGEMEDEPRRRAEIPVFFCRVRVRLEGVLGKPAPAKIPANVLMRLRERAAGADALPAVLPHSSQSGRSQLPPPNGDSASKQLPGAALPPLPESAGFPSGPTCHLCAKHINGAHRLCFCPAGAAVPFHVKCYDPFDRAQGHVNACRFPPAHAGADLPSNSVAGLTKTNAGLSSGATRAQASTSDNHSKPAGSISVASHAFAALQRLPAVSSAGVLVSNAAFSLAKKLTPAASAAANAAPPPSMSPDAWAAHSGLVAAVRELSGPELAAAMSHMSPAHALLVAAAWCQANRDSAEVSDRRYDVLTDAVRRLDADARAVDGRRVHPITAADALRTVEATARGSTWFPPAPEVASAVLRARAAAIADTSGSSLSATSRLSAAQNGAPHGAPKLFSLVEASARHAKEAELAAAVSRSSHTAPRQQPNSPVMLLRPADDDTGGQPPRTTYTVPLRIKPGSPLHVARGVTQLGSLAPFRRGSTLGLASFEAHPPGPAVVVLGEVDRPAAHPAHHFAPDVAPRLPAAKAARLTPPRAAKQAPADAAAPAPALAQAAPASRGPSGAPASSSSSQAAPAPPRAPASSSSSFSLSQPAVAPPAPARAAGPKPAPKPAAKAQAKPRAASAPAAAAQEVIDLCDDDDDNDDDVGLPGRRRSPQRAAAAARGGAPSAVGAPSTFGSAATRHREEAARKLGLSAQPVNGPSLIFDVDADIAVVLQGNETDNECIVCFEKLLAPGEGEGAPGLPRAVFMPCRHAPVCHACARSLEAKESAEMHKCQHCQQPYKQVLYPGAPKQQPHRAAAAGRK